MSNTHKIVLALLEEYTDPVSLSLLQERLLVPERTLRRWLAMLVQEKQVQKYGRGKGTKYARLYLRVADSPRYVENHPHFSNESLTLISQVREPLIKRQPCSYREEWLNSYIPNETFYLGSGQRMRLYENGKRLPEQRAAGTYAHKIFNRLLIDLSYNSSRLEGNTYSLLETEQLLLEGKLGIDKLDSESIMILNHKEAIKFLVEGINRLDISVNNISCLHYLLADGLVASGMAGKVRHDAVRITATTYAPIEGEKRLLSLLEKISEKANDILDPFEQSFFLLVHLSYLQAFIDVNKRTARLAANIPLVRHNLVPLSFNDISKDDYVSAVIAVYELNNIKPLAELYCWSYLRTCKHYTATAQALGLDTIRVLYRFQRRQLINEIVKNLIGEPEAVKLINARAKKEVPSTHRDKFILDVQNDLADLAPYTIAGLGITEAELKKWQKHCRFKKGTDK